MASPNYAQEFFSTLGNILKSLPDTLTADELKAIGPDLESFLTWAQQNPGAVLNPVISGPKLMALKAQVIAAQGTVAQELIASAAGQMNATLKTILTELSAPVAPAA